MNNLPKNIFALIAYFVRPYKSAAMVFVLLAFVAGFWGPLNSQIVKLLINSLPQVQDGNFSHLYLIASLLVLNFLICDNVTWRSMNYLIYKYLPQIKNDITSIMFNHVTGMSHQYFQDNLSGRTASQIKTLADSMCQIFHPTISNFVRGGSLLLAALVSTFLVSYVFAAVICIWLACFISFSAYMSRGLVVLADNAAKSETIVEGQIVDAISNNNNIRLFAKRQYELSWLKQFLEDRGRNFSKEEWYIIIMATVQGILIAAMLGFNAFFLVHLYGKGLVTIGDFALILGITMEVGHMTWYTMFHFDEFNKALGRCKQSIEYLVLPHEVQDAENAKALAVTEGRIAFEAVKFHYKGIAPLFDNKSIAITAGQKVGLVGYSGSGKSTFVNLILRLYNISEGRITIDEQDISQVTQDSLRTQIAMIPQDPSLFNRSIIENIRYSRITATDAEVILAAKKAHAHEFIENLPDGYQSLVGERGVKLSGGQRQRIAIARAILKNAPILILDEATSQLDSVTENLIQESLWELMQGKTTIVIAHRLSTLLHMDRILVFDKGEIVEDGSHKALLKKAGLYKTLWDAQVGGFLGDAQRKTED